MSPEDEPLRGLETILGRNGLRHGTDAERYYEDWRGRHRGQALAVALPASTDEAAATVRFCRDNGLDIYPQGGNTGLCAGGVPPLAPSDCIVLSAERLRRVREIDTIGDVAIVEAGVTLAELHAAAEHDDRLFPLRLGAEGSAQIGGLISTNAGGTGAVRYGVMRDLVLGLEVVTPDGSVLSRMQGLRKDNRGYDWKHLFIGGEGTLGFVTAAALKLFPRMRDSAHAVCAVADPAQAVALLRRMRERFDTAIHAFELVSSGEVALALKHVPGLRAPFEPLPGWMVMLELGDTNAEAALTLRLTTFLETALTEGLITDAQIAASVAQGKAIWAIRHSLSEANKKEGHGIVFDVSVRVSAAPAFIEAAEQAVRRVAPAADPLFVCHLGDGNVHLIAMLPHEHARDPAALKHTTEALEKAVHDAVDRLGGSFSSEHGIGRKLSADLARRLPAAELELMRRIKSAFDPDRHFAPEVLFGNMAGFGGPRKPR